MGSGRPPGSGDVAAALMAAVQLLGQRPAITGHVLGGEVGHAPGAGHGGRREQGFASLAGWVAKGANLLSSELGLGVGDRLALAGPPGWPLAAVALSAWWLGLTVVPVPRPSDDDDRVPALVVTHVDALRGPDRAWIRASGPAAPHFVLGDALDGTSSATERTVPIADAEEWTDAVTPHGDRPPAPAHDGELIALVTADGVTHTQRALLEQHGADHGGVVGLLRHGDEDLLAGPAAARRITALALRPLVTGAATVVVEADDPSLEEHARSERVDRWLD